MKKETLDLSGKGTASDVVIEVAASDILDILKCFDSPKDAAAAFTLAHYKLIVAAFPPGFRKEAFTALKAHFDLIKEFLNEDWR